MLCAHPAAAANNVTADALPLRLTVGIYVTNNEHLDALEILSDTLHYSLYTHTHTHDATQRLNWPAKRTRVYDEMRMFALVGVSVRSMRMP